MAITLDEIQSDEMINEFKRFMHFLTPKDKDIFLKKLMEEIEEAKKRDFEEQIEAPSEQNTKEQQQTDEFITDMQQTIIEESQNITKDSTQEIKEEVNQSTQTQEAQELIQEANTDTIEQNHQPLEQTQNLSFEDKIQNALENIAESHHKEFEEMGIVQNIKQGDEVYKVYDNEFILPKEEKERLKQEYDNAPNKEQWQPNIAFDITQAKAKHQDSQNFINSFMEEVKNEINPNARSMEQDKKLNPNTYFTDLIDWFDKKKMENLNMPISKEDFKKEFYEYCKNGMSENEMKILLILQNKEPSILSKEHKDMLEQGLKYNLSNNKLLDKGLETAITASVGENVTNNAVNDFVKTAIKMEKSDNALDKRMSEGVNQKIAQKIKEHSPNLLTENAKKLDAITNNKIDTLTQSQSQGKSKGR
ncbi:hypothetical protein LS74_000330 [Helicobacter magdeburgensis]|uniref:Uncharacterized protein n=1 Tax=Helicobacter magdeburgensis TaxID=471858 RepID=A0A4U8T391_9HELI|nr:hypothetical protein [Helicobacter magdeburgensis]TLD93833.1 hypothetical protein LS74_000330 [Helicobacter magdeburgensis]